MRYVRRRSSRTFKQESGVISGCDVMIDHVLCVIKRLRAGAIETASRTFANKTKMCQHSRLSPDQIINKHLEIGKWEKKKINNNTDKKIAQIAENSKMTFNFTKR